MKYTKYTSSPPTSPSSNLFSYAGKKRCGWFCLRIIIYNCANWVLNNVVGRAATHIHSLFPNFHEEAVGQGTSGFFSTSHPVQGGAVVANGKSLPETGSSLSQTGSCLTLVLSFGRTWGGVPHGRQL